MKRSITARNVTGGFLGGVLGILSFGYIHVYALPLGCIFGVLIGWWYQEIFQSAVEGWHKGVAKMYEAWNQMVLVVTTPTKKLKDINIKLDLFMRVVHFFVFLAAWVIRSPLTFCRWFKKHPMNQVYVIRSLAVSIVVGLTALWVIPFVNGLNVASKSAAVKGSGMELVWILLTILALVAVITVSAYPTHCSENMKEFYASWSAYSRYGAIAMFFREMGKTILFQIIGTIAVSGVLVWCILGGAAFLIVVIAPLSFAIGMAKGIYKVAMKSGHWLCLIATLVVTLLSAWRLHDYFADARILWSVALLTGIASALAAESLRRLVALFYTHNEFFSRVATTELASQLLPSGRAFMRISELVGERFLGATIYALR
jgi:hypothetical protein